MNDEKDHQRYAAALGLLSQERQLFWQTFSAFFLPHTVLMAFLLQTISHPGTLWSWAVGAFFTSALGFVLSALWLAAQCRTGAYNDFRMAQAREAEPSAWKLLRDKGESFAKSKQVTIGTPPYQMPWLVRRLTTTYAVTILIAIFIGAYGLMAGLTGPWWPQSASILL